MDMGASAREALERDAATWPRWQRRLLSGRRWPVRVAGAICLGVVLVSDMHVPLNGAVVLAARALLVAFVAWATAADAVAFLHFSITVPNLLPRRLRQALDVWWTYPCRLGAALGCSLMEMALVVPAFPSLMGSALASWYIALMLIGLAPVMLSCAALFAGVVLALPIAIPIGIVRGIRNRRDRRYRELYRDGRLPQW